MDAQVDQTIKDLEKDIIMMEQARHEVVCKKIRDDEIRLSKCIEDIMDLHRDMFRLPGAENRQDSIKNYHEDSQNKPEVSVVESDALISASNYSVKGQSYPMFTTEQRGSECKDFGDRSHYNDNNSKDDDSEKVLLDFNGLEIETVRLIKTLTDKFLCFEQKLASIKDQQDDAKIYFLNDLGRSVVELDELVCCIHTKYFKMIDMPWNGYNIFLEKQ